MMDPYEVLSVSHTDTLEDIRSRYRKLCFLYHPDRNPRKDTTKHFQQLTQAYKFILKNHDTIKKQQEQQQKTYNKIFFNKYTSQNPVVMIATRFWDVMNEKEFQSFTFVKKKESFGVWSYTYKYEKSPWLIIVNVHVKQNIDFCIEVECLDTQNGEKAKFTSKQRPYNLWPNDIRLCLRRARNHITERICSEYSSPADAAITADQSANQEFNTFSLLLLSYFGFLISLFLLLKLLG